MRTSRFIWEHYKGKIPDGLCVCHTCDNRACINIGHLFLGTRKENMEDMVRKGRSLKGERHTFHKLTEKQVQQIRKAASNTTGRELAKEYDVSLATIYNIKNGNTWKHLPFKTKEDILPTVISLPTEFK